jgi:hypothetical protein
LRRRQNGSVSLSHKVQFWKIIGGALVLKAVERCALLIDRGETIIDGGFDTGNRRGDRGGFDADEKSIGAL